MRTCKVPAKLEQVICGLTLLDSKNLLILLVPRAGLEPACGYPRWILSPLRLPFRHLGFLNKINDLGDPRDGSDRLLCPKMCPFDAASVRRSSVPPRASRRH